MLGPVFMQILLLFLNTNIPADHVIENSYQNKIVISSFAGSKLDQDSFAISLFFLETSHVFLCKKKKWIPLISIIYFFDRERAVSCEPCNLIGSGSGHYFPIS